MHIVIDGRLILPYLTGIGRYLLELTPALAALPDNNEIVLWVQRTLPTAHPAWQLPAVAQGDAAVGTIRSSFQVEPVDYTHIDPLAFLRIPLDLRRRSPHLFHAPHITLPPWLPVPAVATLHDLKYLARPDFFPRSAARRRLLVRFAAASTLHRARLVLCDSQFTAADAQRLLHADPGKLRPVPLGVGTHFFNPAPILQAALRRRLGLEIPYILFVGERRPHKNLPLLIKTFDRFQRQVGTRHQLLIVGRRYPNYSAPEVLVEQLDLGAQVRFIDNFPDADLPALYAGAAACVLLSSYEGFGLPLLEAMAAGTPVVAAQATALPEVAGDAARLVPLDPDPNITTEFAAEALKSVICDPAERYERIKRGSARAHALTWQVAARRTFEVYREALE